MLARISVPLLLILIAVTTYTQTHNLFNDHMSETPSFKTSPSKPASEQTTE